MELQEKFNRLRSEYPCFSYRSFSYHIEPDLLTIHFHFSIQDKSGNDCYHFRPWLKFPLNRYSSTSQLDPGLLDTLAFHCGMIELISYWKACCCPLVKIECGQLDRFQKDWFRKLYFNGLGEFFYLNGIDTDIESFMEIDAPERGTSRPDGATPDRPTWTRPRLDPDSVLIPIGGGKDSVVTLEILRPHFPGKVRPMIINPRGATTNCCTQAGFSEEECAIVKRCIDPQLLELNRLGFLNGHTPFSAMLAFTSLISATLTASRHIALSNENSANESTVIGQNVNHQYSKSLEFESDFRHYVNKYISPEFNYFSFLRPLSELGIARLFASFPLYHSIFRSCNAGSKTDSWCGNCPKCLFAFIILCPFMGIGKVSRLFGKNLLDDPSLEIYLKQLCGIEKVKPFECVGTLDEVNWALQQLEDQKEKHILLQTYFEHPVSRIPIGDNELESFSPHHFLLPEFSRLLKDKIQSLKDREAHRGGTTLGQADKTGSAKHIVETSLPKETAEKFKGFFQGKGDDKGYIIIVGLGREGQSTFRLIEHLLPNKPLVLVDANPDMERHPLFIGKPHLKFITGEHYLEKMLPLAKEADLIMKSPGVSFKDYPGLLSLPHLSSQTNLFLRAFSSQISGISGTKGKSTTTLLSHHLINAYRPCVLAGNMGIPVFDILDEIGPNTHIICEFSAHQLEQASFPPKVGVLLNLFEEHLDHYASFIDYQKAKMNLAPTQTTHEHVFIYHADDPLIKERLQERCPMALSLTDQDPAWLSFSRDNTTSSLHLEDRWIVSPTEGKIFDLHQPHPLIGSHNELNLMAALLVARANGIGFAQAVKRIGSFQPLPHRLQYVGCINGRHFFNDSISTIPQATVAAMESIAHLDFIQGIDCLIVGGLDRGIDYEPLIDYLRGRMPESIIFVGQAGQRIFSMLQKAGVNCRNYLIENNYNRLVEWARSHTRKGYACVLSPAAASYDQFRNFAHRGDVFMNLVRTGERQEED